MELFERLLLEIKQNPEGVVESQALKEILQSPQETERKVVAECFSAYPMDRPKNLSNNSEWLDSSEGKAHSAYLKALSKSIGLICRKNLGFSEAEIEDLLERYKAAERGLRTLNGSVGLEGLTWRFSGILVCHYGYECLLDRSSEMYSRLAKERNQSILYAISQRRHKLDQQHPSQEKTALVVTGKRNQVALKEDGWGLGILEAWRKLPESEQHKQAELFAKLKKTSGQPTPERLEQIRNLAEDFGLDAYKTLVLDSLEQFTRGSSDPEKSVIGEKNKGILTALVWSCLWFKHDPRVVRLLGRVAASGLRKVRVQNHSRFRGEKVSVAAMYVLSQLEGLEGITQLLLIPTKNLQGRQRVLVKSYIQPIQTRLGLSSTDLEELAISDFGLIDGKVQLEVGQFKAEVSMVGRKAETRWLNPNGEPRKGVPAQVKRNHADVIKEVNLLAKDISIQLNYQADKFDQQWMASPAKTVWSYPQWLERYTQHPLLSLLASRLIWRFHDGDKVADGVWKGGQVVDVQNNPIEWLSDTTRLRLWHPVLSTQQKIQQWREWLFQEEITQPFKQAHREIYLLTDAECRTNTYSNRFASHIIKRFQFARLAKVRGWEFNPYSNDGSDASKVLPDWGLRAEWLILGAQDYDHLSTDQVRFFRYDLDDPNANFRYILNRTQLPLEQIPPLVFSEVMRDVDLFVGVCSVGNDPTWQDGGPQGRYREYWQSYSFGELNATAQTRKELLEKLLPRLKIAAQCELEGRFLRVRGSLRTYKIHLGSSNILMEPNDQYLCIVPSSSGETVGGNLFLPFEGDRTLSVILSKAFLLAADTKITDTTITRQIKVG